MPSQHIIAVQSRAEGEQPEGIIVPLDLPEFKILNQQVQGDGSIEVHVIARINREACPRCRQICVKVHDTRRRVKRDTGNLYQGRKNLRGNSEIANAPFSRY